MEELFDKYDDNSTVADNEIDNTNYDFYDEDADEEFYDNILESKKTQQALDTVPSESEFEYIDETFKDIDFSEFEGDFKSSLKKLHSKTKHKPKKFKKVLKKRKPLSNHIGVKHHAILHGKKGTHKTAGRIIIPRDRKVVVEGVDRFILDNKNDIYKNIGYYKGKKLKQIVFTFNNEGSNDFNLEIFNPSNPLDYLYSTSLNLNNRIVVSGGKASYSDILFYVLANPTHMPNARFVVSASSQALILAQQNQSLMFTNKSTDGKQFVSPLDINQELDTMQFQNTVVNFDIIGNLKRPYIPDGMDVINYTILAGCTVTLCFYFEQIQLKRFFYDEAKKNKNLL